MQEAWIFVQSFPNTIEAHLAKQILSNNGITCFLSDENMAMIHSPGIGGIKLHVHESDVKQAVELLNRKDENGQVIPFL